MRLLGKKDMREVREEQTEKSTKTNFVEICYGET